MQNDSTTTTAQHTAEPWHVRPLGDDKLAICPVGGNPWVVAYVQRDRLTNDPLARAAEEADARVIAAAPTMLTELRRVYDYFAPRAGGSAEAAEYLRRIVVILARVAGQ